MRIECPHCSERVRVDEPDDDDTPVRCPECRKKFTLADVEGDDDRPRKKGRRKEEPKSNKGMQFAIAGGVVALAAVVGGVVIFLTTKKDDPKPVVAANTNPDPQPQQSPRVRPNPEPNPNPNPKPDPGPQPVNPGKALPTKKGGTIVTAPPLMIPAQYAELFRNPVDVPPKTVRAADLRPSDVDKVPEVPTFHSLMLARKTTPTTAPVPKTAKLTADEVKKACAYIKVEAGDMGSTGSGFVVSSDARGALIATNHHVIELAARPRYAAKQATVTAVLNSGLPDERAMKADIVAFDPVADVAILRVTGAGPWPKSLSPYNSPPKLTEGVDINFWGFPLGARLAIDRKTNPTISLGRGAISGFLLAGGGRIDKVRISGTMNPGNSGGPLVDTDGRLVGIAVSIVNPEEGVGIGYAVPVDDLIALLEGRLMNTLFLPEALESGRARFIVAVPVMDPLERVDTVFVRRWAGAGTPPEVVRDPLTGFRPFGLDKGGKTNLTGVNEFPLKVLRTEGSAASGLGIAIGELDVPEGAPKVLLQVASQTVPNAAGTKYTAASKPVAYTLTVADHPVGADAGPFEQLTANPETLAGQTVVVKGRIGAPPNTLDAVQQLLVVGPDGRPPEKMRFLVDKTVGTQFDEVVPEDQPRPVRLVCVVGTRGPDGVIPVRVARLDFLTRGDRVVRTIPAPPAADDKLAELNRDPAKFAGQTLTLKVKALPIEPRLLLAGEYGVLTPSQQLPRNLMFTLPPQMLKRIIEVIAPTAPPGAIVRNRITVVVPPGPPPLGQPVRLAVRRIEFLSVDDRTVLTLE